VAFGIEVTCVKAKRKLSQNRGVGDRVGVVAGLRARGGPGDAALAALMVEDEPARR
jgi:predicted FMN-binding regulatory protein PaiB